MDGMHSGAEMVLKEGHTRRSGNLSATLLFQAHILNGSKWGLGRSRSENEQLRNEIDDGTGIRNVYTKQFRYLENANEYRR